MSAAPLVALALRLLEGSQGALADAFLRLSSFPVSLRVESALLSLASRARKVACDAGTLAVVIEDERRANGKDG